MRVLHEEVVLDLPDVVEPDLVRELNLIERVVIGLVLLVFDPGLLLLELVDESEFHGR